MPSIRERLLADIHTGQVRPGDRLPSIRELARETGENQRTVGRVYRQLEREHLVEIRGRSGVFVADTGELANLRLSELQSWAATVALDGWKRGIAVPDLSDFFQRSTGIEQLKCLFIESSVDQIHQFCSELKGDFGLAVRTLNLARDVRGSRAADRKEAIRRAALDADFLATTVFHADDVEPVAQAVGKPVVMITMSEAAVQRLRRILEKGPITIVAVDRMHRERVSRIAPQFEAGMSVVTVDTVDVNDGSVRFRAYATRAAKFATPAAHWPLIYPYDIPTICAHAAEEIVRLVISRNFRSALHIKEQILRGSSSVA